MPSSINDGQDQLLADHPFWFLFGPDEREPFDHDEYPESMEEALRSPFWNPKAYEFDTSDSFHLGYSPSLPHDQNPNLANPQYPVYGQSWNEGKENRRTRSDSSIEEEAWERLKWLGDVKFYELDLEVNAGEMILTGHVDSRPAKKLIEATLETIPGVRDIINKLKLI